VVFECTGCFVRSFGRWKGILLEIWLWRRFYKNTRTRLGSGVWSSVFLIFNPSINIKALPEFYFIRNLSVVRSSWFNWPSNHEVQNFSSAARKSWSTRLAQDSVWQDIFCSFAQIWHASVPRLTLSPSSVLEINRFCDASIESHGACV